jgi:hypothetical protein
MNGNILLYFCAELRLLTSVGSTIEKYQHLHQSKESQRTTLLSQMTDHKPEVWKPHFQRQQVTKHWSSAESHAPMIWLDTKWNPSISIWHKRSAEIPGFIRLTIIPTQFCEGDESREKCPALGLLKLRGIRTAAISLIAIEDFVSAEEFGQIYSVSNLWQPRIRSASVKIGNQISHKSWVFPLTLAWVRQDWGI